MRRAALRMELLVVGYLSPAPDPRFGAGYLVRLVGGGTWERRAFGAGVGLVWGDSIEPV